MLVLILRLLYRFHHIKIALIPEIILWVWV